MIKLDVKPWCEKCPDFEANMEKYETATYLRDDGTVLAYADTLISCKNKERCGLMHDYILSMIMEK
jgi:hypothetical protein